MTYKVKHNKLLERQVKRHLKGKGEIPEEYHAIFKAISDSYNHYEDDRKLLERSLDLSSQELMGANKRIRHAYHNIEEKNQRITDSIHYAKRIQEAILPPEFLIKKALPNSFVYYNPKDIVSGDFYWMEYIKGKILIAVVDCTGHGVPGAMVSFVGYNGLNRCVKEFGLTKPSVILDKLTQLVEETFEKSENEVSDGMDISLCSIDLSSRVIEYAGANNPLWIVTKDPIKSDEMSTGSACRSKCFCFDGSDSNLFELKSDKQPVGKHANHTPFTNHRLKLQKGDAIYLLSDGYADQFGGEKGKKFKYNRLKEALLRMSELEMEEQKDELSRIFNNWKGDQEQIDDVCLVGIRID